MKNTLLEEAKKITMPEDMRRRIIEKCYTEMENRTMTNHNKIPFRKTLRAAAAAVRCICLTAVTAMAATGHLQGLFRDIKNADGAITGQVYEMATEEIQIDASASEKEIYVYITLLQADTIPYKLLDEFSISHYTITDTEGKTVAEGSTSSVMAENGKITVNIPVENFESGIYRLSVTSFTGYAKAEQPLEINGLWECDFTIPVPAQ